MTLVPDWVAYHAVLRPDHPALIEPGGDTLDYADFDRHVDRLAGLLADRWGVGRGDRVAFVGYNGIAAFSFFYACRRLGAIHVPLNWRLPAAELAPVLDLASPVLVVADPEFADSVGDTRPRIELGPALDVQIEGSAPIPRAEPADEDEPVALLFTSGTTGRPKGVIQTHGMVLANAINCQVAVGVDGDSVTLVQTPCFHTTGLNVYANPTLHVGGTVVCPPRFVPAESLELIGDASLGVTHTVAVPAMWQAITEVPGFDDVPLAQLKSRGVGAAAPSPGLLARFAERGAPLDQGYGMTETGPTQLLLPQRRVHDKGHTVGRPVLHGEHRIVGDDGVDVRPGERGELWVRGPSVTPGYWNDPGATAAVFTPDGWFRTGDVVEADADGFFTIVDRKKEMFISGGENVYPAEVERVIGAIEGVVEAAVTATADDRWGEVGVAFVQLDGGAAVTVDSIIDRCRSELAGYKVPRDVYLVSALPRTATGKVAKDRLGVPNG